ncbi:MAG: hypothetical protein MUE68_02620 [Bacteroidetes bacterium]|jgi:hypothetical protein|nr:hypothetical protein [Bacteroidota bacterium]
MTTGQDAFKGRLLWKSVEAFKPVYELRSNDVPVARISWTKEWGTLAEAQYGDLRYAFKRNGIWNPCLTVRVEGTPYDIARLEFRWMSGADLKLQNGTIYSWSMTSTWRQEWAFTAADGTKPVVFRTKYTMKGLQADVTVEGGFQRHRDAPLLVLLGWYLIASCYSSDGAETAAVMAAIG